MKERGIPGRDFIHGSHEGRLVISELVIEMGMQPVIVIGFQPVVPVLPAAEAAF